MVKNENRMKVLMYVAIALVLFFSINLIGGQALTRFDIDMTEDNLFTLSQGSVDIVEKQKEPITLRFFFSNKIANGIPIAKAYAARIRGLLEEYVAHSDGRITLQVIDPEPFSEEEDIAKSYGIKGIEIDQRGTLLYLGLSATNSVDDTQVIPFLELDRERFLEYEVSRMIFDLANPKRKKVGVIASQKLGTGPLLGIPGLGGSDWLIVQKMRETFDFEDLGAEITKVPDGIDVLMVVQPKAFSDELLYAIDQYVLKGGHVMMFVDPNKEGAGTGDPNDRGFDGNALKLLASWGVRIDPNRVVADRQAARKYENDGAPKDDWNTVEYLAWLNLHDDNLNREDLTTSMLKTLYINSAGAIETIEGTDMKITPLVKSNSKAMMIPIGMVRPSPQPAVILRQFVPDNKEYTLAARIEGMAKSAYPERASTPGHIAASKDPINLVLVADMDILADKVWASTREVQQYKIVTQLSDNASFITNVLDQLSGTNELISLRGRGTSKRPFTKVQQLRHTAEERYLSKEQELKDKLAATEKRLEELQKMAKAQAGNSLSYKLEQQAEIKRFTDELAKDRKDLRTVQSELRKEIETLGGVLKFINIWMMPLLIIGFAVFLFIMKGAETRRKYERVKG